MNRIECRPRPTCLISDSGIFFGMIYEIGIEWMLFIYCHNERYVDKLELLIDPEPFNMKIFTFLSHTSKLQIIIFIQS